MVLHIVGSLVLGVAFAFLEALPVIGFLFKLLMSFRMDSSSLLAPLLSAMLGNSGCKELILKICPEDKDFAAARKISGVCLVILGIWPLVGGAEFSFLIAAIIGVGVLNFMGWF